MRIVLFLSINLIMLASFYAYADQDRVRSVPGEFIVKFYKTSDIKLNSDIQVKHVFDSGAVLLKFDDSMQALSDVKSILLKDNEIEYIEPNFIYYAIKDVDDELFYSQKNMRRIKANEAWDISVGSDDVKVAVIDTGIDYNHEDLKDNYYYNQGEMGKDSRGKDKRSNGIDDDGNGYVDDYRGWDFVDNDNDPIDDHGHGTHCAGIIGAKGDNEIGIAGINHKIKIVGLKFIGRYGGSLSDAVKAIEYAYKSGFMISSNSWGGGGESELMREAIKKAGEKGHLFVAAAGNDGRDADKSPMFPAAYDLENIISVAASYQDQDKLAGFSNFGKKSVDIAAPGVGILSTVPGSKYRTMSGTSMAAPHVSGAAALLKSKNACASVSDLKSKILDSSDKVDDLKDKVLSSGRLNLRAMFD